MREIKGDILIYMRYTSTIKFREMKIVIFLYYMKFHYEFIASSSYHLCLSFFFSPHNKVKNNLNIQKPGPERLPFLAQHEQRTDREVFTSRGFPPIAFPGELNR